MAKKKINFQRRFSKFFLPGILSLALLLCFSVVYAILSVKINVVGTGTVDALRSGDYYYYEGRFYSSPDRYETIPDAEGYALEKMSDAVKQLHDGKTIYMMSSYTVPANEKIEVSGKSAIIKRYKDEQYGRKYSFTKGPLIISSSDLQIDVKDSSSAFILDGNDLECIDSTYDDSMFSQYIGAIYSPSGNLVLNGCAGTNNFIIQNHKNVSGAIFKQNGNFQMNNCKLTDNSVEKSGTALKVVNSKVTNSNLSSINCEINSTEFSNNSGSESSSVVSFGLDCTESDITNSGLDKAITVNMDSCNILDNSLTALELSSANSTENYCSYNVSNTSISNNSSNIGGINFVNSGGILENCSIVNNKSTKDITTSNQSVGGISASNVPLVLKGKNVIKDNILSSGENSNLDFYPSNLTTNELTSESEIGLSCSSQLITEISPANTNKVAQDANQNATYLFADDSENYEIKLDSSYLQLALKPTDYYYKNSKFYRDSSLSKTVVSPDGNELSDMSSALSQIGTQKTVYMMQKYTVSKEENILLSNKSVTIKRDSSFTDGSLFEVNSNLKIDASEKNCSLIMDGNSDITVTAQGGCFAVTNNAILSLNSLQGNIIIQNHNSSHSRGGGAIHIDSGSSLEASGIEIQSNHAQHGGGIRSDGILKIKNCNITNNTANRSGAGIITGSTASLTEIYNSSFINNIGSVRGGGLSIDGFESTASIKVSACKFKNNSSKLGGAISLPPEKDVGKIEISSCDISENTATEFGGGIYGNTYFKMNGSMTIKYNKNSKNEDDDLYLSDGVLLNPSQTSTDFSPDTGSSIGILTENMPTSSSKTPISYGNLTNSGLFSNYSSCKLEYNDSEGLTYLILKQ